MPLLRANDSHFVSSFFGMGFSRGIFDTGAGSVAYVAYSWRNREYDGAHLGVFGGELEKTVDQKLCVISSDVEKIVLLVFVEFLRMSKRLMEKRNTSIFT